MAERGFTPQILLRPETEQKPIEDAKIMYNCTAITNYLLNAIFKVIMKIKEVVS